jgi:hypothetical protein
VVATLPGVEHQVHVEESTRSMSRVPPAVGL